MYGSEGERVPEKDRWNGKTERRSFLRKNGNGESFDVKLDRFIKIAGILKYFLTASVGAMIYIVVAAHDEIDHINKSLSSLSAKVDQNVQVVMMHDQYRRERDRVRLQTHHQEGVGTKDSCIRCKVVDFGDGVDIFGTYNKDDGKK